jgi:hypothetical protein
LSRLSGKIGEVHANLGFKFSELRIGLKICPSTHGLAFLKSEFQQINLFLMKSTAYKNKNLKSGQEHLPVHSLAKSALPVFVRDIQHKNPYDFTRVHRHDYFEIF